MHLACQTHARIWRERMAVVQPLRVDGVFCIGIPDGEISVEARCDCTFHSSQASERGWCGRHHSGNRP